MGKGGFFYLVFLLFCATMSFADNVNDYVVELKPTKKIIHVDRLGISGNACVNEVLRMMPEMLLQNDYTTGELYPIYEIQVDGKDVGQSRDVVLMQTRVVEVDVIEVSTSPTVSEQKNGQGGVINIKRKPITEDGVAGNVMIDGSTEWDVQPSVLLNYKKDNFTMRSSVMLEYYCPTSCLNQWCETDDYYYVRTDTSYLNFRQETAKLDFLFTPTQSDEIKIRLWESLSCFSGQKSSGIDYMANITPQNGITPIFQKSLLFSEDTTTQYKLSADANIAYVHKYKLGGELKVEFTYHYNPNQKEIYTNAGYVPSKYFYSIADSTSGYYSFDRSRMLMSELSSKHMLLPHGSEHVLEFEYGLNANYSMHRDTVSSLQQYSGIKEGTSRQGIVNSLYVSPYVEFSYDYQKWHVLIGARYQYYRYESANRIGENNTYDMKDNHTGTANFSIKYQVANHHCLRLLGARNVVRSTSNVFPTYNVDLHYIFDWQRESDYIVASVGTQAIHALLRDGRSTAVCVNAQMYYKHDIFALAFAGNGYWKEQLGPQGKKSGWYYNLLVMPIVSFKKQWTLSAQLLYHSKIISYNADYGDCFYAQLRLSKDIKQWHIHVEFDDILGDMSQSTLYNDRTTIREEYDLYKRALLVGFGYKF